MFLFPNVPFEIQTKGGTVYTFSPTSSNWNRQWVVTDSRGDHAERLISAFGSGLQLDQDTVEHRALYPGMLLLGEQMLFVFDDGTFHRTSIVVSMALSGDLPKETVHWLHPAV
jgi:hypothetical protein